MKTNNRKTSKRRDKPKVKITTKGLKKSGSWGQTSKNISTYKGLERLTDIEKEQI